MFLAPGLHIPGTICDVVWCCYIVNKRECITFVDGDRVLDEAEFTHVNLWAAGAWRFILD